MSESVSFLLSDESKMVNFGDVVRNVSKSEKNPCEKGLDRVVGLEHIDPYSLHINRWDSLEDGTSFSKTFRKGQVLFGKRRAYQGKVAIAEFNGICSGDIYVFEAVEEHLFPELLPFILQSDSFYNFAVKTSSGSLSPRTNWKHLVNFKFSLPPIDEQQRLAKILWAAEDALVKNEAFLEHAEQAKKILMRELFSKGVGHTEFKEVKKIGRVPVEWEIVKLGECAYIKGRIGWKGLSKSEYVSSGPYLVAANHIDSPRIKWVECDHISKYRYDESPEIQLKKGDIILSKDGTIGRLAIVNSIPGEATINSTMMLIRPDAILFNSNFIYHYFNGDVFRKLVKSKETGSAIPHIFQRDMNNLFVPIPSIIEQEVIIEILNAADAIIAAARESIAATKALKMRLINQFFSEA